MKTLEVTITGISEYILDKLPKIRKNVKRNRIEYVGIALYSIMLLISLYSGYYLWVYFDLIFIIFISLLVGYRNMCAKAMERVYFYDELSASLLRERHGIQRVTDIKFETSYDKENDIFNIDKRIDPEQKQ